MNKFLSVSVAIYSLKEFILFFYSFRNNFTISTLMYYLAFLSYLLYNDMCMGVDEFWCAL